MRRVEGSNTLNIVPALSGQPVFNLFSTHPSTEARIAALEKMSQGDGGLMGFLDSILGTTKLPESKTEKLFAISTAEVTLETKFNLKPDGLAAVCIKPVESSRYETARSEDRGPLQY